MAIYNLRMSPANGRSAVLKYKYISRTDDFSWEKNEKYDDFLYSENINMPLFAKNNPLSFWENVEKYERIDSNDFREIEFSLPAELSIEENIELSREFATKIFGNNFVYSLAVHSKKSSVDNTDNIHCHIMFSERELDGIERSEDKFFKRANSKIKENGGCKKNREWSKYSKLYEVRQTWEKTSNEKLTPLGISISDKSLKAQKIEAILENNFLKAEMLDRPPVNIDKNLIKFSTDEIKKEESLKFFEYASKIKKMKETTFKLKSENFEEENKKAKERFMKKCFEEEGIEFNPSVFDIQQNQQKKPELEFNFENIFVKSVENKILADQKEKRFKHINSITDKDINERALKILTKGKYQKNLKELEELTSFYNELPNKDTFEFKEKKNELEKYFNDLKNSKYFQDKLTAISKNIKYKYDSEKEKLLSELSYLRDNDYKDFYLENTPKKYELSREIIKETKDYIENLKIEKEIADKDVKEYKATYLDIDIKKEIYQKIKPASVEKYEELKKWQKELKNITEIDKKQELSNKILKRELSLKNFDIKNNINELISKELNERRNKYKGLRQIQDSITGKITHSCLMMKELKTLNEIKVIDKVTELQNNYNKLLNQENEKLGRLEYNIESKKATETFKRIFNSDSKLKEFIIPAFAQEEMKDISQKLKSEIKEKLEENIKLRKLFADNSTTDEKLRIKIFDRNTNNFYSKQLKVIKYYEEQIEKGISVPENTIMLNQKKSEVEKLEKNFKITSEDLQTEKQIVRSEQIEITSKIRTNNEKIDTLYKIIKELKIQRKRVNQIKINKNPESHKSKKLRIMSSGRIVIDESEELRRNREWENSL